MEYFDWVLKDKFNALPSNNTKSVENKDPTNVMDIDFEGKVF